MVIIKLIIWTITNSSLYVNDIQIYKSLSSGKKTQIIKYNIHMIKLKVVNPKNSEVVQFFKWFFEEKIKIEDCISEFFFQTKVKALGSLLGWYCIYLASIQCCIYWMTIIVVFCIEHLKKTENIVLQWLFLKLVYICIFVIFGVELKNLIWYMYEQLFFFISIQYSVKTLIRAMCRSREGGPNSPWEIHT